MIDLPNIQALLRRACSTVAAPSVAAIDDRGSLRDVPSRRDDPSRLQAWAGEHLAEIPLECLRPVLSALIADGGLHHLSAITALDNGSEIEALYHLWLGAGLTLRIRLPYDAAVLPSVGDLLPVALWYEREVHELLGIAIEGHPNLKPLLLPEEWDRPPPLRQDRSDA
jgi:NADH:ubiquinone oxidoreductase subunit C